VPPIKLKSTNVMPLIGEEPPAKDAKQDAAKEPAQAPKGGQEAEEASPSKSGCHVAPGQGSPALPGLLLIGMGWLLYRRQRKG
jgi:MYXO-CTERM domain-containing protein